MVRAPSLVVAGMLALAAATAQAAAPAPMPAPASSAAITLPSIPFTRFTLPNGLTVVVSEDHKAPIVAVAVWYHVGSAREPMGKSGYAHLFEHLMFEASQHHPGNYFQPFEKVGAIGMNGTTARDRTNYFETVPSTAVDLALWMESDRMGHLLGALTKDTVDQQRGVVQNEKRQGENQPYGRVQEIIEANAYPLNHPYHHDTIGSMKDLNAASIEDFKHWFNTYYGAANATLVLVGDITPDEAKAKALKYFGDIPAGPPVPQLQPWTFPRTTSTRDTIHSDVPQVRIYREWNTPHSGTEADNLLSLAATVLGDGKTSRLYQRLVYQDKLADNVSVSDYSGELGSQFELQVHVRQGVDPKKVDAAIADEWAKFLKEGPTEDELQRAKTGFRAYMVRRIERVGGFGGKATLLAAGQVYHGDPAQWRKDLAAMMAATPNEVRDIARKWLSKGDYTLTVLPLAEGAKATDADAAETAGLGPVDHAPQPVMPPKRDWHTVKSDVDRSKGVPEVASYPELTFPEVQHATLDNGIKVTLAARHNVPLVEMRLQFDAGYAADQGRKLGTAGFTMAMLDEGTKEMDSVEIAKRKQRLGAIINSGCGLDTCTASLNALADKVEPSLALLADIVQHPAFRDADVARLRQQWLARIKQEEARPITLALRVGPPLIYGKGHAYAIPFTGSGTTASIKSLTTADMRQFMHDYIRPDNVTILVAGDTTLDKLVPRLNAAFGHWQAPDSAVPEKNIAKVDYPGKVRVYLMDRPGSEQSVILAALVSPSTEAPNHLDIETMNGVFGGTFTSRLNMNLREGKHWAYGAHSFMPDSVGQSPFLMYAPVQTDKTAPSVREMLKEAKAIVGPKPPTDAEIEKIKQNDVRSLPGQYQTDSAVLSALANNALYDRPDNYVETLKSRINGLDDEDIVAAAREVIHPDQLTWIIVGDLKKIEKPVRALKLGEVKVIDASGKVVR
ncbi:MAG TPA: pitrilysin family protein [Rhodanobacteraceae bacterium]|nr:pitrilysin family protein [Rhodanobacteraceae bacterium]